jgi:hypothetical protein
LYRSAGVVQDYRGTGTVQEYMCTGVELQYKSSTRVEERYMVIRI